MARPPKKPGEIMTTDLRIPVTADQKAKIKQAVEIIGGDMTAWARPILLAAADAILAKKPKPKGRS
jgi:hypothetical protein